MSKVNTGIFIDDTGSPGLETNSRYLASDRKTWVAIIFSPEERIVAETQMNNCIDYIKQEFGADEFHFKDIYNGNNKFKGIELNIRLGIFACFASLFKDYQWPIIVQTFNKDTMIEHKHAIINNGQLIDNFNFQNHHDCALFFLLIRCKDYLASKKYKLPVDIIIDEGRQKANSYQDSLLLSGIASNNRILYSKSADNVLIQLADFAAFCLNRMQYIFVKEEKKDIDLLFAKICEDANFNYINLPKVEFSFTNKTVDDYDYFHYMDKTEKGLLTAFQIENFKRKIDQIKVNKD